MLLLIYTTRTKRTAGKCKLIFAEVVDFIPSEGDRLILDECGASERVASAIINYRKNYCEVIVDTDDYDDEYENLDVNVSELIKKAMAEKDKDQDDRDDIIGCAHADIRSALALGDSDTDPYRFDYYATVIEKMRNQLDQCQSTIAGLNSQLNT